MPKHLHRHKRGSTKYNHVRKSTKRNHNNNKRIGTNRNHNNIKRRHRPKTYKIRGGGFISDIVPNDILNVFRSVPAGITNIYDGAIGRPTINSNYVFPTQQMSAITDAQKVDNIPPPDILNAYKQALLSTA